jgi:predicted NBD/HSP70 family sugar kinase
VAQAAIAVGVNFSHTYVDVGFVDLLGRPLAIRRQQFSLPTLSTITAASFNLISEIREDLNIPHSRLLGIGFSVPGDFLPDGGLSAHAYFPDLWGVDMRRALSRQTDLPVFVENDGKACAIGEMILGAGQAHRSFMVVHIGHGVGGGIVIDGRIYRGAFGNAGPIGSFWPLPLNQPRPSGQDLLEMLNAGGVACRDFDELEVLPKESDQNIEAWVDRAALQLEDTIPKIARFIDPEVVVLGGRLPPKILKGIVERVDQIRRDKFIATAAGEDRPRPILVASQLGTQAGIVGSAMLPIHRFLLPQN